MLQESQGTLNGLSWLELFRKVWVEIQEDDLFGKSAQLGFYFLLAVFPALLCLTALIGLLPIQSLLPELLTYLNRVLPRDVLPLIETYLDQVVSGSGAGMLSVSFLGAFWAVSTGMAAIIDTLNTVYNVRDSRPLWKSRAIAMVMTIGCSLFVIISMILILAGGYLSQWIAEIVGYGVVFTVSWAIIQWPLVVLLMLCAVSMIYYLAPNVTHSWRVITPGSVVAVVLWFLASLGFKYYVAHFGTYNAAYGSLAGVIVLMLWLYMSGLVLLIGGEVDVVIKRAQQEKMRV
ncbi:YihY/virulence factor BrkB family protein [Nitrospira sp. M1]